jgi:hypothetical protein
MAEAQQFWSRFLEQHWRKQATVFRDLLEEPILSPGEAFEILKRVPEQSEDAVYRVLVDGKILQSLGSHFPFIPLESDGTLEGYGRRIERQLGGSEFCIIVNRAARLSPALWRRTVALFAPLAERVGLPMGGIEPVLFFGNYRSTPFGIHHDNGHAFTFNVLGRKRFLAWPHDWFREHGFPTAHGLAPVDPELVVGGATVIEPGPLDVGYWPPSHWHVGVGSGQLTCSLSITADMNTRPGHLTSPLGAIAETLHAELRPLFRWQPLSLETNELEVPVQIDRVLDRMRAALDSGEARRVAVHEWMRRTSSLGCMPPPPPRVAVLARLLERPGHARIHYTRLSEGELVVGANGRSFDAADLPEVRELLDRLERREGIDVEMLLPAARKLAEQLAAAGALS